MFLGMFFRSRHNLHPSQETYPDVENFPYLVQYFHPATFRPQKVRSRMSAADDNSSSSSSSLHTPREIDFDEVPEAVQDISTNYAEEMFSKKGRTLMALALLAIGLKNDDGSDMFDRSHLPWSAALRPSALKLTAADLRDEVVRRSVSFGDKKAPRPNQWTMKVATKWLMENPIKSEHEVAFIKATIASRIEVASRAALEPVAQEGRGGAVGGSWVGKYPHLRLIHAVIDDNDIKTAYLSRLNIPSGRMAIEQRHTAAAKAANVWQMVAEKWNDPLFLPVTSPKADLHSDFALPIAIAYDTVATLQPATAEKVEEKWSQMNLSLRRGIQKWERSGQGDGGFEEDDAEFEMGLVESEEEEESDDDEGARFGSLKKRSRRALDNRRNFFDGKSSYLLYMWEMLCEHGLIQSSMQQLHDGIGSGNGSTQVPLVVSGKRKYSFDGDDSYSSSRKSTKDPNVILSASITSHGESLRAVAAMQATEQQKNREQIKMENDLNRLEQQKNRVENRITFLSTRVNELRDNKRVMILRLSEPGMNQVVTDAIMEQVKDIDKEIEKNMGEIANLMSTPVKSNRTPPN